MIYHPELSVILTEIPEDTKVHAMVWIGKDVKIGHGCSIQAFCYIPGWVTLEDDVFLGPRVTLTNDLYPPSYGKHWKPTLVKRGASIGASATINPGVTIGEGSLIGSGSVVTKDVPAGEIWAGNPARFLRKREDKDERGVDLLEMPSGARL